MSFQAEVEVPGEVYVYDRSTVPSKEVTNFIHDGVVYLKNKRIGKGSVMYTTRDSFFSSGEPTEVTHSTTLRVYLEV